MPPSTTFTVINDSNALEELKSNNNIPLPYSLKGKSKASQSAYTTLLLPLLLFPLTTALAFIALTTLPLPTPLPTSPTPKSLSLIASTLTSYASDYTFLPTLHLLIVLAIIAVWKHAWSIPGAILLNVLAGSIWGGLTASLIMTFLTALGSVAATLISRSLSHWFEGVMPRAIQITRSVLDVDADLSSKNEDAIHKGSAPWMRLALLRLIGVVPWSGLNIASGIVRVSITDCFLGAMIGCLPWTVVTCQVGDILNALTTGSDGSDENERTVMQVLSSWEVLLKLGLLTLLSILPILGRGMLKKLLNNNGTDLTSTPDSVVNEKPKAKRDWHWPRQIPLRILRMRSTSVSVDEEKLGLMVESDR